MNTKALLEPMGSWAWWRSWFLIFLGCSVMGAGFVLFVNPYKFVPGGVYGMGIVLHNIFPSVQVGTFGYMFDIPLMLISMLVFGGGFGTRTVLAALYTPGFMNVLTRLVYPNPEAVESLDPSLLLGGRLDLSNDLLLTCVIGAVVIGIGQGFQPVAGYNFGAGDKKRTRQAFWFSVLLGTAVCIVCAAVISLFPDEIMHFFRDDAEVTRIGRQALLYACAVMPLMGYSTYVNQLYQCLGFHQAATLLASCRNGLLYVPLILILPRMLGLPGVEMSQPGADLLTFVVSLPFQIWFFRHKLR